jgi:molecular chaperone DnaK (HSP70)
MSYKAYVGIDFGTSNSAIAYAVSDATGKPETVSISSDGYMPQLPTAVYQDQHLNWHIGQQALERGIADGVNAQKYLFTNFKRDLKQADALVTGRNGNIPVKQLATMVVEQLIQNAISHDIDVKSVPVVATHPVGEHWKQVIHQIYDGIGFKENLLLISEPEAAIYYAHSRLRLFDERERLVLLIDFGGGTCDFILMRVKRELLKPFKPPMVDTIGQDSYSQLGGTDIDWLILQEVMKEYHIDQSILDDLREHYPNAFWNLLMSVKNAKESLSKNYSPTNTQQRQLINFPIPNEQVLQLRQDTYVTAAQVKSWTSPAIKNMFDGVMFDGTDESNYGQPFFKRCGINAEDISLILLTGGSSQFKWIYQEILPQMFPHLSDGRIQIFNNSHLSVVNGAAIYAHDKYFGKSRLPRTTLSSLKIILKDGTEFELVPRGTKLPVKIEKPYRMPHSGSTLDIELVATNSSDNYESLPQKKTFEFDSILERGKKMRFIVEIDERGEVLVSFKDAVKPVLKHNTISFNNLHIKWESRLRR